MIALQSIGIIICDPLSEVRTASNLLKIFSALSTVFKEWVFKISAESGE